MRLVAGALALTLFASFARAEGPATPAPARPTGAAYSKIPLRVVRVMPESRQAQLNDRSRSTHVLVEVGGNVDGYAVEDIDDDEVTLQLGGRQFVLAAPARAAERRSAAGSDRGTADHAPRPVRSRSAAAPDSAEADGAEDRTADTSASDPTPVDPYGEPAIRVAQAPGSENSAPPGAAQSSAPAASRPIEPGEDGVRVAQAPDEPAGDASPSPSAVPTSSAHAPSAAHRPGIRVAQAPRSASAQTRHATEPPISDTRANAPGPQPSEPGIRAVEAPGAEAIPSPPAVPSDPYATTPPPAATSAMAPPIAPTQSAPRRPGPTPAASATMQPLPSDAAAQSIAAPTGAATRPTPPPPSSASSPSAGSSRAPLPSDPQTLSARAMADVLTGGGGARDGRKPRPSLFVAQTSDVPAGNVPAVASPSSSSEPPSYGASASAGPSRSSTTPTTADARAASAGPREAVLLSRGDVDAALADFAKLTAAIHGSFSADGVVVDAVGEGTLFQRAGLRAGDVIAAVDGTRLRSLDDAANLYARAAKASTLTAQIVRGGKPITLHVAIR
jgi:hypothetical protein